MSMPAYTHKFNIEIDFDPETLELEITTTPAGVDQVVLVQCLELAALTMRGCVTFEIAKDGSVAGYKAKLDS